MLGASLATAMDAALFTEGKQVRYGRCMYLAGHTCIQLTRAWQRFATLIRITKAVLLRAAAG